MHTSQVTALALAINGHATIAAGGISLAVEKKTILLISWLSYLQKYQLTNTADSLLIAVGSSIREVSACLSLGLIRPAIFSLRMQIDLVLSWLYFKDHPVEWDEVNRTGDGFKMKRELLDYLNRHHRSEGRINQLKGIATRREKEPYRLLSAHIHGQSQQVLPSLCDLKDLVAPNDESLACAELAFDVAEYLNDVLLSIYRDSWRSLPQNICQALESRFVSEAQKQQFFS